MKNINKNEGQIAIYQTKTGAIEFRRDFKNETIWATQAQMAEVFGVNPQAVTKHLKNVYQEGELLKKATCSKLEQVQTEGGRSVKRNLEVYNLDAIISVGYRISSKMGTKFRQWATKTLRSYIVNGYTINRSRIALNYDSFLKAVEDVKALLPAGAEIDNKDVLELITLFSETWLSLDAYDKDEMVKSGSTKKAASLTAEKLRQALADFKSELAAKGEAGDLFGAERQKDSIAGIVGNVMQSFGGRPVYPSVEEKAAHLLYFMVKNHPFVDGNKRSGAYAFIWFLQKAGILNRAKLTPPALTAMTLLVAESNPKNIDRMIRLILQLLKK
jgi:prophage maintenance system killer protein